METKKQYMTPYLRVVDIISENDNAINIPVSQNYDGPVYVKEHKDDELWTEEPQTMPSQGGGLWDKAW